MSFRTLMQAGPTKANELFVKLSETSDGAVKTRERLFAELKAELELHASLEEQHLFPILRRNAETKDIVTDAIKDNKELRTKLAELETLPKSDETFLERLKELQKTFRQHARDEKRELLPAVQRALSEEQVQGVAEKIEAGVAEAEQVRQDELEARRLKARQEREQAEQEAEKQAEAERAQQAAAEQARQAEAQQEREQAERQAEQAAAARRPQDEAERRILDTAKTVAQTTTAAQAGVRQIAENATTGAQRVGAEIQRVTAAYIGALRTTAPDLRTITSLPNVAVSAMAEIRSAWIEWVGQTTLAGGQTSQELLRQATKQQRQFAAAALQGWLDHNARIMQITMRTVQEGFRPFENRTADRSDDRESGR
jgi:iron-sulfur cluster repair protein YtfE (RIC family)